MEGVCQLQDGDMCVSCQFRACGFILIAFLIQQLTVQTVSTPFGGFTSPTYSPIIPAVSRAAKKIIGTRVHKIKKKEPVSPHMIRKLVEKSNLDNLLELRNVCVFILAYVGFFRIEEILHL